MDKQECSQHYSGIGGQAVLEGVMMKNGERYAVAVRKEDGSIVLREDTYRGVLAGTSVRKIPVVRGFFELIDSCEGKVELVTGEGDRLNLKSKLSQYISLANIFSVKEEIPEMELVAYDPEDVRKLIDFMINQ